MSPNPILPFQAHNSHSISALAAKKSGGKDHRFPPENPDHTIIIEKGKLRLRIPVRDILFAKAEHVYCRIFFVNDQRVLQRTSLEKLLNRLTPQDHFLRVHRSYVINTEYVQKFTSQKIFIREAVVPIGRTWREQVMARLRG